MGATIIYDAFNSIVEDEEENTIQKIGPKSSSLNKIVWFISGYKIEVAREDKSLVLRDKCIKNDKAINNGSVVIAFTCEDKEIQVIIRATSSIILDTFSGEEIKYGILREIVEEYLSET